MSAEVVIFAIGAVLFVITTSATFLFGMLRFNEVYENPQLQLETLESVAADGTTEIAPEAIDSQQGAIDLAEIEMQHRSPTAVQERTAVLEPQLVALMSGA